MPFGADFVTLTVSVPLSDLSISHSPLQNLSQAAPSEFSASAKKKGEKKKAVCAGVLKDQLSRKVFTVVQTVQEVIDTTEPEITELYCTVSFLLLST